MKLKDIAVLSCKILSITVFIKFIYFSQVFGAYYAQKEFNLTNTDLIRMSIVPVLLLLISMILWFFATKISILMVEDSVSYDKVINFEYHKIKPIIFSVIGLILLTQAVPSFARMLINIIADIKKNSGLPYQITTFNLGYFVEYILKILIALCLIIGPKKVLSSIKSTRIIGLDKEKNN